MNYSYGNAGIILSFFICLISSIALMVSIYWITHWTEQSFEEQQREYYPAMFVGILIVMFALNFARVYILFEIIKSSTNKMHQEMV